jgi:Ni/Fe-hydrogenase subunit HybB-like protein
MSGASHHEDLRPVGGTLWTPVFKILLVVALLGVVLSMYRFVAGIGATSAMNDGYAWGSWKVLNVIVLTALGSGGYAMALIVYVLNKGRYHPLVRTAILTSALGYTTGAIALTVDIGRPWNMFQMGMPWQWNLHSVLFEIAICVSLYLVFLWIEMAQPIIEHWSAETKKPTGLKALAVKVGPWIERYFVWIVATAILLPTMHQSSLGSLFLLAGPRLNPLWQTPFLPLLFLLSCYTVGYAAVVLASKLSALAWNTPVDWKMLSSLSRVMAWVLGLFLVVRWLDVIYRGALLSPAAEGMYRYLFYTETLLLLMPAVVLQIRKLREDPGTNMRMAIMIVVGGCLYRLDAALIGFMPGTHFRYFPSVIELLITLGFVAMGVAGYIYFVKRFPILAARYVPRTASND